MLKATGHPFVDIGAAAIAAYAGRSSIDAVTEADLKKIADYMTDNYTRQPLKSFLTVAFPNSGYTQPAFDKTPERRMEYANKVLLAFQADTPTINEACVFTGQPANLRVFRQHIPLLNGEDVINFSPGGEAGLPVSGIALLCIQAFPLACAKCAGRLLAVDSDNPEITLSFARSFLNTNIQSVLLAQQAGQTHLPESQQSSRTLLIDTLLKASREQKEAQKDLRPFSITAYHLSNSGQSPSLEIYHLPSELVGFLQTMTGPRYHQEWGEIVRRAWELAPPSKGKSDAKPDFIPRRNYLYEDLFRLPESASRFIRTYFLRLASHFANINKSDPRSGYQTSSELNLVSWKITQEFLRKIMHMDKQKIERIEVLGKQLARYVHEENDRRFFRSFFAENRYDVFRTNLLRASMAQARSGKPPLVSFETYITVFEESDVMVRPDWRLSRDLVLIKIIEELYQLGHAQDTLQEMPEAELEIEEPQTAI